MEPPVLTHRISGVLSLWNLEAGTVACATRASDVPAVVIYILDGTGAFRSPFKTRCVFHCRAFALPDGKLANSRCRAFCPAVAGHLLVNSARKTNIAFGAACFSFALITLYHVLGAEGKAWGKE